MKEYIIKMVISMDIDNCTLFLLKIELHLTQHHIFLITLVTYIIILQEYSIDGNTISIGREKLNQFHFLLKIGMYSILINLFIFNGNV